jgi:trans-feruloyl-CoA hydratase/vanillin synthase
MLQTDDHDGVRCIGLNRPNKRNAIGVELTLALEQVLLHTKHDPRIHAIVFHGIGGNFCAGMDMKDFFDSSTRPADVLLQARQATEHWRTRLLPSMPQPIFTAVQGFCFGAAMPILNASRVVLASPDAKFGLPEINFGFVPGGQIVKAVGQMMHPRGMAYAALTGRPIDAERAKQWGLVTHITEEEDPLLPALALAREAAKQATPFGNQPH